MPVKETSKASPEGAVQEIDIWQLAAVPFEQRITVLSVASLVAFFGIILSLLIPPQFASSASIYSEGAEGGSSVMGIAAQFGFAMPGSEITRSPAFLADLMRSRRILSALEREGFEYFVVSGGESIGLSEALLGNRGALTEGERREALLGRLKKMVSTRIGRETGIVTLEVRSPNPVLSKQLADRILALARSFDVETRQARAVGEREFLEDRIGAERLELEEVEARLQEFLERNRTFENSPDLLFRYNRLRYRVDLKQQVMTSLAHSYEQARLEEVRSTPSFTILEEPEIPLSPTRSLGARIAVSLFLAAIIGLGAGFFRALFQRGREVRVDGYRRLTTAINEATPAILGGRSRSAAEKNGVN